MEHTYKNLEPYSDLDIYQTARCGTGVFAPIFVGTKPVSRHLNLQNKIPIPVGTSFQFLSRYNHPHYQPLAVLQKNGKPIIQNYNVVYTGLTAPPPCEKLTRDYSMAMR